MADILAVKKRNGMRNLIKLNLDVVLDQVARLIVFRKLPREIASSGILHDNGDVLISFNGLKNLSNARMLDSLEGYQLLS